MYNALIRTHHIISRKKLARVKKAAQKLELSRVLIRTGAPGLMYVEGNEAAVEEWVGAVQSLKYKDFHVLRKPAILDAAEEAEGMKKSDVEEVESVADFAAKMDEQGLLDWWRRAMGYTSD